MNIEIINKNFTIDIYGFSGMAPNKDYAGTAFALMGKMWQIVKAKNLKNKGVNIWVYDTNEQVFAGVELYEFPAADTGLEHKSITLTNYAYYNHIGPYHLIKKAGQNMKDEIKSKGLIPASPTLRSTVIGQMMKPN